MELQTAIHRSKQGGMATDTMLECVIPDSAAVGTVNWQRQYW